MRESKFKAWHKTLKLMLNVYVISQEKDANGYTQTCRGWYGENRQITFSYDQVIWMQFTGLHDKNGKSIYEEDIVSHDGKLGVIKCMQWLEFFIDYEDGFNEDIADRHEKWYLLEVIGNIEEELSSE